MKPITRTKKLAGTESSDNSRNAKPVRNQTHTAAPVYSEQMPDQQSGYTRGLSHGGIISRMVAPAVRNWTSAISETLVILLVFILLCRWIHPADPLLIQLGFPYAWLLPLIISLRYGTLVGLVGCFMLGLAWYIEYAGAASVTVLTSSAFPTEYFMGGLLLVLIGGQFGDIWANRLNRARYTNAYLSDRFSALSKNHFLLRLSHERLENDLLSRPTTLRDTMMQLRRMAFDQKAPEVLPAAETLMQMAAQACQLASAALYEAVDGKLVTRRLAHVGELTSLITLDLDDPMVRLALERNMLMHVQSPEIRDKVQSRYLVCAPVLSGADELLGMLVVDQMPFVALTHENLQFLLVLLGYYADGVRQNETTSEVLDIVPQCPFEFALDYGRLARLQRETGVESRILALIFGEHEMQEAISSHILRSMRALDLVWTVRSGGTIALLMLMPLSGDSALGGYLLRIENSIRAQFGVKLRNANIMVQALSVGPKDAGIGLAGLLKRCKIDV